MNHIQETENSQNNDDDAGQYMESISNDEIIPFESQCNDDKGLRIREISLSFSYMRQEFIHKYDIIIPSTVLQTIMNSLIKHALLRLEQWEGFMTESIHI